MLCNGGGPAPAQRQIKRLPAIGADHTQSRTSWRWPGFKFNLFSRTSCAVVFATLALFLILFCVCSYLARRRAVSGARHRFVERLREIGLVSGRFGRSADEPPITAEHGGDSNSGQAAGDCPVCLEPLRGGSDRDITAAHTCGHVFHAPCIEPWLDQRDSCPVCRCIVGCNRDPANDTERVNLRTTGAAEIHAQWS